MVVENGQSEDRYQDSVGCLKIHVDLLKLRKLKNTNFQLSRTPKIIEIEPMSTENGPPEGIPDRISDERVSYSIPL